MFHIQKAMRIQIAFCKHTYLLMIFLVPKVCLWMLKPAMILFLFCFRFHLFTFDRCHCQNKQMLMYNVLGFNAHTVFRKIHFIISHVLYHCEKPANQVQQNFQQCLPTLKDSIHIYNPIIISWEQMIEFKSICSS